MTIPDRPQHFDEKDISLLEAALELIPDLDIVTYATELARGKIKYPIKDHSGFLPLFGNSKSAKHKEREITFGQVEQFFPIKMSNTRSDKQVLKET